VGVDYNRLFDVDEEIQPIYKATGNAGSILANRISWFYDLRGPSMTVETACSSSMVALHLACQSLRTGESKMVSSGSQGHALNRNVANSFKKGLVAGSQLYLEPLTSAISLSSQKFMSSDSRCLSFDDKGSGYGKGEGFGALILKPLTDAVADGDTIRAVIRSTTTNQDGRTPGITQPSLSAQEDQIREAYKIGGLDFHSTRLFEAHGTGTPMGDPIEAEAIRNIFHKYRSPEHPMYVGSVKSNIGHLEAVAGLAGVIKVILCLEKGIIPPNAGFETLNRGIKADEWHLTFPTEPVPWPCDSLRRASVNSFGYGGSNAHVVIDDAYNSLREHNLRGNHCTIEAPPADASASGKYLPYDKHTDGVPTNGEAVNGNVKNNLHLLTWSTSDSAGVGRIGQVYRDYLSQRRPAVNPSGFLRDLAFTLSDKRSSLPWKSYIVADSYDDLVEKLEHIPKPLRSSVSPRVNFIFTGQGAQWATMGLGLLSNPGTRACLLQAQTHFRSLGSEWSLVEELEKPGESSRLSDPDLSQPVCTALQVALVELLASWGVQPQGVVGHSSGEIAAAFCAGAIDRESAWTIAYFRGALAAKLAAATAGTKERGAMMSVQLSEEELQPYLEELARNPQAGDVAIGCENSAFNLTLTGLETAIDFLKVRLDSDGIFARKLAIPVAYHSSHMQVIAEEYLGHLRSIRQPESSAQGKEKAKHSPIFVSSVTGDTTSLDKLCHPEYWVKNLVSRVRFSGAVTRLHSASPDASSVGNQSNYCIEVGPHPAMQKAVRDTVQSKEGFQYDTTLRRGVDSKESLLNLAGRLFAAGYPINIQAVNADGSTGEPARMLPDLPKYPFNHSQTYWLESRLVKNYRQRDAIRHELFGLPVTDWNPLKPRWRQTIRSADNPWLKDHQIDGTLLYPGAAMLTMVVEAARSMTKAKPDLVLKGYRLREVTIHGALVVPSDGGVEVQLYMQNQKNSRTTGITTIECREFCLSSYVGNEWKDVCSGLITTEYADKPGGIFNPDEDAQSTRDFYRSRLQEIVDQCPAKANEERVYRLGKRVGFEFGPTFQTLSDISYDPAGRHSVATVILDEWMTKLPTKPSVEPHVIHPTALDGVLQTMSVMINKGGTEAAPLHAPTQFLEIWISNDLFHRDAGAKIRVGAKTTRYAVRDLDASITALHTETMEPVLTIEGYRVTTLMAQSYEPSQRRNLFYEMEWKPDVELLGRSETEEYCIETAAKRLEWDPEQQIVCLYYLTETLAQLKREGFQSPKHHLQKYQSWIQYHLEGLGDKNPILHSPWKERLADENRESFMAQFSAKGRVEKALQSFCSQLPQIIREEVDPLDLLFNQGLANDIYSDDVFVYSGKRAAAFVDLVAHKNPNMDILEIGAGTGTATDPILASLLPGGDHQATPRYNSYTFTDISPSFFEKAADRLAHHADRMIYKTLDVEQDPSGQGFESGKYDMVVAAAVLHATANIKETLRNTHSLLKPGGYLVLVEPTNKWGTVSDSIWGTLSGWWRGTEEDRQQGPLYSRPEWDARLRETGFIGIEACVLDHAEENHHTLSLLVSRTVPTESSDEAATTQASPRSVTIMAGTEFQQQVAADIASHIKDSKYLSSCAIVSPSSLLSSKGKIDVLVALVELEDPVFSSMTDANLAMIKSVVDSSSRVYWFTSGGGAQAPQPEKAMSSGFSRAITQEHPGLWFANIDVNDSKTAAETFARIYERDVKVAVVDDDEDRELDYQVSSNQVISIPRVIEAAEINEFVHSQTGKLPIEMKTVGKEPTEAMELEYSIGQLESFRFVRDESVHEPLADDDVEVEIKATGVNFIDVMVLLGQLAGTHFGCEYSGVVRRVGSAVTTLKLGDRVCFLGEDGFRTYVRCKAGIAAKIPDSLPFTEVFAAVYLTTIHSLNHVARLRKGETILVHAAAGGVGQAAIQLAQHIGADVFVTVSSADKRKLMTGYYGIPDNRIFYSRNLSFGRQIRQATNGRGVDVVLNSLSGEALAESFRLLAPLGRFVEIGKRDIHTFQNLPMQPFLNNVAYHAVNTKSVEHARPEGMRELVLELEVMLAEGIFQAPRPVSVFARGQFESAIRYLQSGRHMGKAVVDWEAESEIPMVPKPDPATKFDPNATYLIAGGLGGIGRSLAAWFGRRGVKNLVLLSRSGPTSEAAIKLVKDLRARGVTVATPQCDVTNTVSLKEAIETATKTMPPVKGCIQASMVLKVSSTPGLHHTQLTNTTYRIGCSKI
jgi:acyl transferase domain-containing protein/NADPH:quinone reductase-like Zn-dependent oxidoreductase/SAM-dependent methyltransferase